MAELIRLGAYRPGADPDIDEAIFFHKNLEEFLSQDRREVSTLEDGYQQLRDILETTPS
jgi:flagellum-specific ATP synthase